MTNSRDFASQETSRRTVLASATGLAAAGVLFAADATNPVHAIAEAPGADAATKGKTMNRITVADGAEIYFKDWGTGQPVVFSHGWPLSADDWDAQLLFFLNHGYRVIAHDRRGGLVGPRQVAHRRQVEADGVLQAPHLCRNIRTHLERLPFVRCRATCVSGCASTHSLRIPVA